MAATVDGGLATVWPWRCRGRKKRREKARWGQEGSGGGPRSYPPDTRAERGVVAEAATATRYSHHWLEVDNGPNIGPHTSVEGEDRRGREATGVKLGWAGPSRSEGEERRERARLRARLAPLLAQCREERGGGGELLWAEGGRMSPMLFSYSYFPFSFFQEFL